MAVRPCAGFSGSFTAAQLDELEECFPGAIAYCEAALPVHKTEVVHGIRPGPSTWPHVTRASLGGISGGGSSNGGGGDSCKARRRTAGRWGKRRLMAPAGLPPSPSAPAPVGETHPAHSTWLCQLHMCIRA